MEDNKSKHWFKRRRYGYGWTPVTWQGWLTVAVFLVAVISVTLYIESLGLSDLLSATLLIAFLVIATMVAVWISYVKGPRPKWRWGSTDADNPSEDI